MADDIDTELRLAFMDVDAANLMRREACDRADRAIAAARERGDSVGKIAATVGRDRTTIQKRIGKAS
jgi:hypothetical protein